MHWAGAGHTGAEPDTHEKLWHVSAPLQTSPSSQSVSAVHSRGGMRISFEKTDAFPASSYAVITVKYSMLASNPVSRDDATPSGSGAWKPISLPAPYDALRKDRWTR